MNAWRGRLACLTLLLATFSTPVPAPQFPAHAQQQQPAPVEQVPSAADCPVAGQCLDLPTLSDAASANTRSLREVRTELLLLEDRIKALENQE